MVVYMRFGNCMGTLGSHKWSFICGLGSVWGPKGVIGGRLYEV